ncbi:LacI family DNA-binding transcriptional regulator [Paenibacillus koleovorans]|uniref:LacI family DNA-binding transcriptional regulator n=1 Tax=Paenibacillus koleovorans TaxID=121608 RepID=UPI000FD9984D|nr:LacI family DNA-binding transcriptional regulator [Paenibacillus koleovorans]
MPIKKTVTQVTIARELGVSVQTVSKALKGKPGMAESTRKLILATAEKLGYFSMEQIRSLKAELIPPYPHERKRFLLVQTEESVSYNKLMLEGLHERFASFGHRIELCRLPKDVGLPAIPRWVESSGMAYADGLFLAPSIVPRAWEAPILQLDTPKILLNFPPAGSRVDSVIWDIYEATYQAVAYLYGIGHRRILYTGDTYGQRGFILRWQAFQQAMREFGIAVDTQGHSISRRETGGLWLDELNGLIRANRPTAILCGISNEVEPVFRLLGSLGLRVPKDVSFVGMPNEQPGGLPLLTRPLLSIRETGYRAADRMLWRLANPTLPFEHTRIQGDFYIGETTRGLVH